VNNLKLLDKCNDRGSTISSLTCEMLGTILVYKEKNYWS
jgi:hypothetical protein